MNVERQQGVALAFSMLMLLVLTVISVVSLRSSIFELRMARNEEARVTALERAQSIIDGTAAINSNLIVAGAVGDTNCMGPHYTGCTTSSITLDAAITGSAFFDNETSVQVERLNPEFAPPPPILGSSANVFDAAQFSVEATYDSTANRQGRATLTQGLMVLVATGGSGGSQI